MQARARYRARPAHAAEYRPAPGRRQFTPLPAACPGRSTGIAVSAETVRLRLDALGSVCKRPTWTLTRNAEAQRARWNMPEGGGAAGRRRRGCAAPRTDVVNPDLHDALPPDAPTPLDVPSRAMAASRAGGPGPGTSGVTARRRAAPSQSGGVTRLAVALRASDRMAAVGAPAAPPPSPRAVRSRQDATGVWSRGSVPVCDGRLAGAAAAISSSDAPCATDGAGSRGHRICDANRPWPRSRGAWERSIRAQATTPALPQHQRMQEFPAPGGSRTDGRARTPTGTALPCGAAARPAVRAAADARHPHPSRP
jgi:hypothetical protein